MRKFTNLIKASSIPCFSNKLLDKGKKKNNNYSSSFSKYMDRHGISKFVILSLHTTSENVTRTELQEKECRSIMDKKDISYW
jgi:hypothetical protein